MTDTMRNTVYFAGVALLIVITGFVQSWNSALFILNFGLISAIMALGVNLQWGFAGLFNVGIMGFVALGGLATVLVSMPATPGAWEAGGGPVFGALLMGAATVVAAGIVLKKMAAGWLRHAAVLLIIVVGFFVFRSLFDPAVALIEDINPASTGYLGGLGLPVVMAWPVGGVLAAAVAWLIGKTALGLRSDYLAIATLGISEIIIAVMKNEDWLARGVKNVAGLPRPAPYRLICRIARHLLNVQTALGLILCLPQPFGSNWSTRVCLQLCWLSCSFWHNAHCTAHGVV
jgi:branched-chain amino acid transport system permease protein